LINEDRQVQVIPGVSEEWAMIFVTTTSDSRSKRDKWRI